MATSPLVHIRRGQHASNWIVGIDSAPTVSGVSEKSITSVQEQNNIESVHVKDADGITRMSVYFNSSTSVNVTANYEGTAPSPGETLTYLDKEFQITNVSVTKQQSSGGQCTITAEYFAGWGAAEA